MKSANIENMLQFLNNSPTAFQAIDQIKKELVQAEYEEISESASWNINSGGHYFTIRNHSSLIAFQIPQDTSEMSFNLCASHSDSPAFKVKPESLIVENGYLKLNTEGYGGMLCSTWMDRPLSLAGRVIVKEKENIAPRLINIDRNLLTIPSLAIHMNRDANSNASFNQQIDMLPIIGLGTFEDFDLKEFLANEIQVSSENLLSYDLYLYCRQPGYIWGVNQEFISSPHLDDLQCAYTTLQGFLQGTSQHNINVYCCFDNEEVGSRTRQGAASTFLIDTLQRIMSQLNKTEDQLKQALASSLMLSADNAHAIHPNFPKKSDPTNRVYLNQGIVIKYNANQSYTSDAISSALFTELCRQVNVPFQYFTNRSDLKGGGTLGNISSLQVSVASVDIGLAQLAMHSVNETAGVMDSQYMIDVVRCFYSTRRQLLTEGITKQTKDDAK